MTQTKTTKEEMTWKELSMLLLGILLGFVWMLIWRAFDII